MICSLFFPMSILGDWLLLYRDTVVVNIFKILLKIYIWKKNQANLLCYSVYIFLSYLSSENADSRRCEMMCFNFVTICCHSARKQRRKQHSPKFVEWKTAAKCCIQVNKIIQGEKQMFLKLISCFLVTKR